MSNRDDWFFDESLAGRAYTVNSGRVVGGTTYRMVMINPVDSGVVAQVPYLTCFADVPVYLHVCVQPSAPLPAVPLVAFRYKQGQPPSKMQLFGDVGLELTSALGVHSYIGVGEDIRFKIDDFPLMEIIPGMTVGVSFALAGQAGATLTAYWAERRA